MSSNVKGLEKLLKTLQKIPKELEEEVGDRVEARAQLIERDAKRAAPVGTPESTGIPGYKGGSLRQSIRTGQPINTKNRLTWSVFANATGLAPYAQFVEFGTRFMRARPFLIPAFRKNQKGLVRDIKKLLDSTFDDI